MGIVALLRGSSSSKVSQPGFVSVTDSDWCELASAAAETLMTEHRYLDAVVAYRRLGDDFPELRGHAEMQRGVAFVNVGRLADALRCFTTAREFGASLASVDEHVWRACEGDAYRYSALCPHGAFAILHEQ